MPIRFRITILFTGVVFLILSIVCMAVYYFSYSARINAMKTRLANRAITTAHRLIQSNIFDPSLMERIDSSSTISLRNKAVVAFDEKGKKIYSYSDIPFDTLRVATDIFYKVKQKGQLYLVVQGKEAVAYHYTSGNKSIVVIYAGEDQDGALVLIHLKNVLVASWILGVLIAIISGYLFSGGLLRPIKNITDDVKEISAQNLKRRIKTGTSSDEWFYLSNTLNELLNRLQESFELQRRFISNASHELSTPLTSISSQLEVYLNKDRSATEYKNVLLSVLQDVKHMITLTQTLLEFAKASGDTGGLAINLVRIDEILLALPAEVKKLDPSYSVTLRFDQLPEEDDSLYVFGSEVLLHTAVKNVIINACKYSGDHCAEVTLHEDKKRFIITVRDEGEGIAERELNNIFEPFYRVNENSPGFGLGLSLAQRIIKLHKGNIMVDSKRGIGTVFTIILPTPAYIE